MAAAPGSLNVPGIIISIIIGLMLITVIALPIIAGKLWERTSGAK
jgi:rhamnose transport system permease protein